MVKPNKSKPLLLFSLLLVMFISIGSVFAGEITDLVESVNEQTTLGSVTLSQSINNGDIIVYGSYYDDIAMETYPFLDHLGSDYSNINHIDLNVSNINFLQYSTYDEIDNLVYFLGTDLTNNRFILVYNPVDDTYAINNYTELSGVNTQLKDIKIHTDSFDSIKYLYVLHDDTDVMTYSYPYISRFVASNMTFDKTYNLSHLTSTQITSNKLAFDSTNHLFMSTTTNYIYLVDESLNIGYTEFDLIDEVVLNILDIQYNEFADNILVTGTVLTNNATIKHKMFNIDYLGVVTNPTYLVEDEQLGAFVPVIDSLGHIFVPISNSDTMFTYVVSSFYVLNSDLSVNHSYSELNPLNDYPYIYIKSDDRVIAYSTNLGTKTFTIIDYIDFFYIAPIVEPTGLAKVGVVIVSLFITLGIMISGVINLMLENILVLIFTTALVSVMLGFLYHILKLIQKYLEPITKNKK